MKEIRLEDYTPPSFLIESVELCFQLFEDKAIVVNKMLFQRNPNAPMLQELILNGEDLLLLSLKVNGQPWQAYSHADKTLKFSVPGSRFEVETITEIRPQENKTFMGLYKSGGMFCTQMEPEGFRRVTFYLDRTDVLTVFTTRIEADREKYPVLLSNGNLVDQGELPAGRHYAVWYDPFKKPCYLFALVAGNLDHIHDTFCTQSGREVSLNIYTEKKNIKKCDFAMQSLKKSMAWDEKVFGREYDLDLFNIVAVDDFNFGAMENKGLNIFNASLLLANPETAEDQDYANIESVVAHEYFHNWSGNRVTLRDWFQLSLKEGFTVFRDQEFSADMNSCAEQRISDVRHLRNTQFSEDAGPMAHPVQPKSYMTIANFYTMTIYAKGAELIRMMKTLLGDRTFRRACDIYFEENDGKAVTIEEFVGAMEKASGMDLRQFRLWYHQAGTPSIKVDTQYDLCNQTFTLTLKQSCPPTPGQAEKLPFHIPVRMALLGDEGRPFPLKLEGEKDAPFERVLSMTSREQTWVFHQISAKPVPSLLRGFSAPVNLEWELDDHKLEFLLSYDSDPFVRWDSGFSLALKHFRSLMDAHQKQAPLHLNSNFVEAFRKVLHSADKDPHLAAELLHLPEEGMIEDRLSYIPRESIDEAREFMERSLGLALENELFELYKRHNIKREYRFHPQDVGSRKLKNACLNLLVASQKSIYVELAFQQLRQANNMTDERAALSCLSHVNHQLRQEALKIFYERWKNEPLVMNKWLAIQANAKHDNVIEEVKRLAHDPVFDGDNPNKIRSLYGSFARNARFFHHPDGAGYKLIADQVIALDKKNPMVAAGLAQAFKKWKKYDTRRRELMRAELERIKNTPRLSTNVMEVVSRFLA